MSAELEPARRGGTDLDLMAWADQARAVHQIALSLSETAFVPPSMRGKPSEITGCILAGRELGLSPLAALRSVDLIDGVPAIRAVALRGLVQAHGHEIYVVESTETRCVMRGRRRGESNVQTSTWTVERARRAGLAGKSNWSKHPTSMLVARATAEICRLIAADVLVAMPLAIEELADDLPSTETEPVSPPKKRTAQRKPWTDKPPAKVPFVPVPPKSVEGPSLDDVPEQPADGITDGMRKALHAGYRDIGVTDRSERLAHASAVLGRPVGSVNELTHAEGHDLLAALEAEAARRGEPDEAGGAS